MAVQFPDASVRLVGPDGLVTNDWLPVLRLLFDQANASEQNLEDIESQTPTEAFDAISPTTTQGDLIVRGATVNERFGIGASGSILTSNGTMPVWSPASTLVVTAIEAGALSSQPTLDIDLSADYDMYEIDLINVVPTNDSEACLGRFSQSGSFLTGASDYFYGNSSNGVASVDEAEAFMVVSGGTVGNGSAEGFTSTVRVFRPGASSFQKTATWAGVSRTTTPASFAVQGGGGLLANTNAIDGVRFFFTNGIATGHYAVRAYRFT